MKYILIYERDKNIKKHNFVSRASLSDNCFNVDFFDIWSDLVPNLDDDNVANSQLRRVNHNLLAIPVIYINDKTNLFSNLNDVHDINNNNINDLI